MGQSKQIGQAEFGRFRCIERPKYVCVLKTRPKQFVLVATVMSDETSTANSHFQPESHAQILRENVIMQNKPSEEHLCAFFFSKLCSLLPNVYAAE